MPTAFIYYCNAFKFIYNRIKKFNIHNKYKGDFNND